MYDNQMHFQPTDTVGWFDNLLILLDLSADSDRIYMASFVLVFGVLHKDDDR